VLSYILTILGCVAVLEGLVLVLAPSRFEDLIKWLGELDIPSRRNIGLLTVALGVFLVWISKYFFD
tara:strand:- start:349 stop:546 length:198 start_codon:yes stop_codon:yes gene_type:complete